MKAKTRTSARRRLSLAAGVGRALRRAARDAQKTARMYGSPLQVWENGKVVAKKDFVIGRRQRCNMLKAPHELRWYFCGHSYSLNGVESYKSAA